MRIPIFKLPAKSLLPFPTSSTSSSSSVVEKSRKMSFESKKQDAVVIMGATGTGKTKLSIDLAKRFAGEVINSDKIQVYRGLDITTNKITDDERRGVPHHLLGDIDPADGELSPFGFRELAAGVINDISARRRVPIVAGGSNSFIHAALVDRYDPRRNPFSSAPETAMVDEGLRYRSCFLWVHVDAPTLAEHLDRRVDEMIGDGMVEELERYFMAGEGMEGKNLGLGKAIGVPEFRNYFTGECRGTVAAFASAVASIKSNTRLLAAEQVRKIERLSLRQGWEMKRVDATAVVAAKLSGEGKEEVAEKWERHVLRPSMAVVGQFLKGSQGRGAHQHRRLGPRSDIITTAITTTPRIQPWKLRVC